MVQTKHAPEIPLFSHKKQLRAHTSLHEIEERLLKSIYLCHYLTIPQLTRWHYLEVTRSHLNSAAAVVKRLVDTAYVQRGYVGRAVRFGGNLSALRLASRGIAHLAALGYTPLPHFRPQVFPSHALLKHTLQLNEVLIAALLLPKMVPGYQVVEIQHDWMFRQQPIPLDPGDPVTQQHAIIPDGWIDFRLPPSPAQSQPPRLPVHIEFDRATESSTPFETKLCALIAYSNGPYERRFHTPLVTIAFVTTEGATRLARMLEIARHIFTSLQAQVDASIFFFATLPPGALDPREVFLTPIWFTPFEHNPKVLLSLE